MSLIHPIVESSAGTVTHKEVPQHMMRLYNMAQIQFHWSWMFVSYTKLLLLTNQGLLETICLCI